MNLFTILVELWYYDSRNLCSKKGSFSEHLKEKRNDFRITTKDFKKKKKMGNALLEKNCKYKNLDTLFPGFTSISDSRVLIINDYRIPEVNKFLFVATRLYH